MKKHFTTFLLLLLIPFVGFNQSLSSINPNSGNAGQTLDVTITGVNTSFDQGTSTAVYFAWDQGSSTINVNSINVLSATTISANITIPSFIYTGDYSVYTSSMFDGTLELMNAFHVNGVAGPELISTAPSSSDAGTNLDVTITGMNTHFTQGSSSVYFMQGSQSLFVNSIETIDDENLMVHLVVPSYANLGFYDLNLFGIDGNLFLENAFEVTGTSQLYASVTPYNASDLSTCDGSAWLQVQGGLPPYQFVYSNGSTESYATDLCPGFQSVVITDANNTSITVDFVISTPSNTSNTDNYWFDFVVGDVFVNAEEDCEIDYSAIDSAMIVNSYIEANGNLVVEWNVYFGNAVSVFVESYVMMPMEGVYNIYLELYCPNKSTGQFWTAIDRVYYNPLWASVAEINAEESSVILYPNPFVEQLQINTNGVGIESVEVFNLLGELVYSQVSNDSLVSISHLNSGQYVVQVRTEKGVFRQKVLKY
jgi:hypothetical protein